MSSKQDMSSELPPPRSSGIDLPTQRVVARRDPDAPSRIALAGDEPRVPGYEILDVLGKGGMGIVYKARHVALKRIVALKVILAGAHADSEQRQRFRTEAAAAARLQHGGIVQVYDIGECFHIPYFSLEYVRGGNLAQRLADSLPPPRLAAEVMMHVSQAVAYAHAQGIIHRDLKPGNILLAQSDEHASGSASSRATTALGTPKITDFGLAKCLDFDQQHTATGQVMGTPAYMAPEQALGKAVGPAADIYSLGVVLYEMLTGRPPFRADTVVETLDQVQRREPLPPSTLQPAVPRDLETIVLRCLQKEPRQRYAAAGELADDLDRFLAGEPIRARRVGPLERSYRWCRRNPAIATLCGAIFLTMLGGTLTSLYFAHEASLRASHEKEARVAADEAKNAAQVAQQQAESRLVRLKVATGANAFERDQRWTALLWFHQAWKLDPAVGKAGGDPMDDECHRLRLGCLLAQLPQLEGVAFHDSVVRDAWFMPDDQRVLTLDERGAHVSDPATYRRLFTLPHPGEVRAVAHDPGGRWIATAGADGSVRLWQASDGSPIGAPLEHGAAVESVAVQPGGRLLATGDAQGTLRWWSLPEGELAGTPVLLNGLVETVSFSPDGTTVAAWCKPDRVYLVRAGAGEPINSTPRRHVTARDTMAEAVYPPVFTPDSARLLTSSGRAIRQHAVADATPGPRPAGPDVPLFFLALAPDGKRLAHSGGRFVHIAALDRASGVGGEAIRLEHGRESHHGAWHPSGRLLATCSSNGEIWLRDVVDKTLPLKWQARQGGNITRLAFSRDGARLLAASRDGAVRIWKTDLSGMPLLWHDFSCGRAHLARGYAPPSLAATAPAALVSADGRVELRRRMVADAPSLASVTLVERSTGKPLEPNLPADLRVDLASFSRDGSALFTNTAAGAIVWDLPSCRPRGPIVPTLAGARLVSLSDNGERVAVASHETALAYETRTGRILMDRLTPTVLDPKATSAQPIRSLLYEIDLSADGRPGKLPFLSVEGIVPMQGGVPVIVDGKVIGAVGVSGVSSAQDEQVALAALAALAI